MRTGTPLWSILIACALTLTLFGCKMQLSPTSATKTWCCATCPGYTQPSITVAFLDHRGDPIPNRRVYITGGGPALQYARDEKGAPLPTDNARQEWMYVITGTDGKATVRFDMPQTFDAASGIIGGQTFHFQTHMDGQPDDKPLATKELKVTIGSSCQ